LTLTLSYASIANREKGLGLLICQGRLEFLGRNRRGIFLGRKGGENNQTSEGGKIHA
jgi:hypothetical protein